MDLETRSATPLLFGNIAFWNVAFARFALDYGYEQQG